MEKNNKEMKNGVEVAGANVYILGHRCYRCGHSWIPRSEQDIPETCPKCRSPYWKKPKVRFKKGEKKNGREK